METELKVGEEGVDYCETKSKALAIGTLALMLAEFQKLDKEGAKEALDDLRENGEFDLCEQFYLTVVVEDNDCVPMKTGQYGLYPCEYDIANYYGLSPFEDF